MWRRFVGRHAGLSAGLAICASCRSERCCSRNDSAHLRGLATGSATASAFSLKSVNPGPIRVVMAAVSCSHCDSLDVQRRARLGLWDMAQNLFGRWPYVCRGCRRCFYAEHRTNPRRRASPRLAREPSSGSVFECAARRQGANAAIVIRAENDHQLTNILLALSRAVEAEQFASNSGKKEPAGGRRDYARGH